ncbi:hypothetical protein [Chelonobacter oris]|uniref:hypothetical protein n=1 Tax=Chelonobacter oris TaxID=505317 RepID=UPI001269A145|nr:hypothetical protein [Chelonobacter oris]
MTRFFILVLSLLSVGCSVKQTPSFQATEQIAFNGKTFALAKTADLTEMVRYIYNPNGDSASREKVTLFFDRNRHNLSLSQRLSLRQRSYRQSADTLAELTIDDKTLYSTVIYRPSRQFAYWGVEVTKGKNIADCGFLEFQYSYGVNGKKQSPNAETAFLAKIIYPAARQYRQHLQQQPWLWQCS